MGNIESTPNTRNKSLATATIGKTSLSRMRNKFHKDRKKNINRSCSSNKFNQIFGTAEKEIVTPLTKRLSEVSTLCDIDPEAAYNPEPINKNQITLKKNGEELRKDYIARIITNSIYNPILPTKSYNSIIIYDWDDTLLPTTFLAPDGYFLDNIIMDKKISEYLRKLELSVFKILNKSISKGETYIITNAGPGWIEYSAKKFYPSVYRLLNKMNIISARGEFEERHPNDKRQWKISAFLEILKKTDTDLLTNLICIGDSVYEMEAAHILASNFKSIFIKTVKFKTKPHPKQLYKEINLLINEFSHITNSLHNLTVSVYRYKKNGINIE